MKAQFFHRIPIVVALFLLLLVAGRLKAQQVEPGDDGMTANMRALLEDQLPAENLAPLSAVPCVGGMAGIYPCDNVDLLSFTPLSTFAAGGGNDIWGWTDPLTDIEYALMGLNNGTAFVDISDPENPLYLGKLPTHTSSTTWRDIKVYADHAFIVSEATGHGMQVFDLTELRNVNNPPVTFSETAHYAGFSRSHNLVINEDSGYAYSVGGDCSGGLHMIDISTPTSPTFAGCFSADGYTHDAQCVIYNGPDVAHQGAEICFNSNEDTLTIVDVTDKGNPTELSRTGYSGSAYTHQGWLTEDHQYFVIDDELDEIYFGHHTRSRIFDLSDLDQPAFVGYQDGTTTAIDHNLYNHMGYSYQANYRSGLRILDLTDVATATLPEVAYFDIYPASDSPNFNGAWSNYPFFESGVVIVSGMEQGLFVLAPNLSGVQAGVSSSGDDSQSGLTGQTLTYTVAITNTGNTTDTFQVGIGGYDWTTTSSGDEVGPLAPGASATVEIYVTIGTGTSDQVAVSFTSMVDPNVSTSVTLSSSTRLVYMPLLIMK